MNTLFVIVFLISTLLLLFTAPENFLAALLDGASKSATLCCSLIATYAVWLGLMRVWEDCGVARKVSKLLKPLARRLFKTDHEEALDAICMNLSVNLLGISGAATPYGITAAKLLDKTPQAEYSSAMFFILNATSLQLLPTSLIAVRVALHSATPNDIVLPIMLASALSTLLGLFLTRLFVKPRKEIVSPPRAAKTTQILKMRGAGI